MKIALPGFLLLAAAAAGCSDSGPEDQGQAPAAPSNVQASIIGDNSVKLVWDASPGAVGYKMYMASVSPVTRTLITTLPENMTHTDLPLTFDHPLGLAANTKYFFVVTAVGAGGEESGESCEVEAVIATKVTTSC